MVPGQHAGRGPGALFIVGGLAPYDSVAMGIEAMSRNAASWAYFARSRANISRASSSESP